jgi:hypothetical protein
VPLKLDIEQVNAILATSPIVASWQVLVEDETIDRAFYKIRCRLLRPMYQLEIRLIQAEEALLYSYQVFTEKPIMRWDNAPHFPTVQNFPHHFHNEASDVEASLLTGDPVQDLPEILSRTRTVLIRPPY